MFWALELDNPKTVAQYAEQLYITVESIMMWTIWYLVILSVLFHTKCQQPLEASAGVTYCHGDTLYWSPAKGVIHFGPHTHEFGQSKWMQVCLFVNKIQCSSLVLPCVYWQVVAATQRQWGSLTHWGRVTHICVNKLTIIGSDNGLSPGRRQAIIWTNAGIVLIGPMGTNFSEILIEI